MTVFRLPAAPVFPDPRHAEPEGLLAVGGDLSPARLLAAYAAGVFPWYSRGEPILWWSPEPRFVLDLAALHVPRSLQRTLRRSPFDVRFDTAFDAVVARCARVERRGERGTWITPAMSRAYGELHRLGFAHSVEVFEDTTLAGGLYGVSLGGAFFGESMFADRTDASKVALVRLVGVLCAWSFDFVDCQVPTDHLRRLGAVDVPRARFLERLELSVRRPTRRGSWSEAARDGMTATGSDARRAPARD